MPRRLQMPEAPVTPAEVIRRLFPSAKWGNPEWKAVKDVLAEEGLVVVSAEDQNALREEAAYCRDALNGAENRRQMWRERAEKAEAARTVTRERLDALIADGFGATTDTLRELRAALDDTEEPA
jgi:hypothetical protein